MNGTIKVGDTEVDMNMVVIEKEDMKEPNSTSEAKA